MAAWSEEPVVDVANGVVRSDQERGFGWKLSQMNWNVELFSNHAVWVRKKGERKVAEIGFESCELLGRSGAYSDNRTTDRCEEVVLLLEREASPLACRRVVS